MNDGSLTSKSAPLWRVELRRLLTVVVPVVLVGLALGHALAALALALALVLGWHLYQLWQLDNWLRNRRGYPSAARTGYWRRISDELFRLQRSNRKRRKRVRKLLKRFKQAADALPEAAVILDADLNIVSLNPASQRLLGLRKPVDFGHPISNLFRSPAFADYISAGDFDGTLNVTSPVDRNIELQVVAVPYGGNQTLLLARDVTRLARLEQMRTDLVANVSHELRSPLTVIVGYLEALEDEPSLHDSARDSVEQMRIQSRRMCSIVEDLLHLSRLEADSRGGAHEEVDVASMLASIRADVEGLDTNECEVAVELAGIPRLLGDYGELYSAFSNLAFNAARHTPAEGRITLRLEQRGDDAVVSVMDTGVGIEAHHVPRLTERFYRIDQSRSRQAGGTGLGLAIVKHVLMRHEARLDISSMPGEGSTFACVFPAKRVRAQALESAVEGSEEQQQVASVPSSPDAAAA